MSRRFFCSNDYRLYSQSSVPNIDDGYISWYTKSNPERGDRIVHVKSKTTFLKAAGIKIHMEFFSNLNVSDRKEYSRESLYSDMDLSLNYFEFLPRETILYILKYLDVISIAYFSSTSKLLRDISYDNQLWKHLCFQTWSNPYFMMVDMEYLRRRLRAWYKSTTGKVFTSVEMLEMCQANTWRLIFIALHILDTIPSIVPPQRVFAQKSIECFSVKRSFSYDSSVGSFRLVGVRYVSLVEYTVYNFVIKPWHRIECVETRPIPIYDIRSYGLKLARTVRGQNNVGFYHRRGYFLKTDRNRKIHLSYRYFPAARFRLYQQGERVFLLCQDLVISSGLGSDCYTMFEVLKTSDISPAEIGSSLASTTSVNLENAENSEEAEFVSPNSNDDDRNVTSGSQA